MGTQAQGHGDGTDSDANRSSDDARIQQEILRAVRDVKFGSVEFVIHDSRVVQVERREKIRFQTNAG